MCFTPLVSLSTAIIEFLAAASILIFFKKSATNRFYALFIFVLGFYQFTEFMLCTSNNSILWVKLGFITYSFLPAIALHFMIRMVNLKFKNSLLYIFPLTFSLISLVEKNFVIVGECTRYFVKIQTIFSPLQNNILFFIYLTYYFGFIIIGCFLLGRNYKKERNKIKRNIYSLMLITMLATLTAPLILFLVIPSLGVVLPSLYCQFAFLFTFAAVLSAWINR